MAAPLGADEAVTNPLSLFDVAGQSIVITGASGAMGRAVACALAALGARLLLVSGSEDALDKVAAQARGLGGEVRTLAIRPDTLDDATTIVSTAVAEFGRVDSVFVASGYNDPAAIERMPVEQWRKIMDANVLGPWLLAKAFGEHAAQRGGGGRMVLVSSVRGRHGSPAGYTAYCTSKGAVDALTKTLATEWGPRGINVNAIAPAVFRSALTDWIFADTEAGRASRERNMMRIAKKRLGEPEDFVGLAIYLLSAASDFVTGQIIYVDGGYTAT
jgi:NAD(P)-dependent dehydrogenase (short-subunit alcohol dehydrogenase family)